jgi:hypothetical protein
MAYVLGRSLTWKGRFSAANQLRTASTLIANTQLQPVIDSAPTGYNYGAQVQSGVIYSSDPTLVIRIWIGYSNTNWATYYPGPTRRISSYSATVWTLKQIEWTPTYTGQFLNRDIELTVTLPSNEIDSNTPLAGINSNGTFSITLDGTVERSGSLYTSGFGPAYTDIFTSAVTTPSQSKEWQLLPTWDSYSDSDLSFTDASSTTIKQGIVSASADFTSNIIGGKRIVTPAAALSTDFSLVAAPGRIKLGQALLSGSLSNNDIYIDADYFNGTYIENSGLITAVVDHKAIPDIVANVTIAPRGNQTFNGLASFPQEIEIDITGGYAKTFAGSVSADFTQTAAGSLTQKTTIDASADFTVSALGGVIRKSSLILPSADFTETAQGRMIYDVGISYAYDWVRVEDDYVSPYYYLNLSVDTSIYAAASVEVVPYANISADSTIRGTGGYFNSGAQLICNGTADFNISPIVTGGTGIIFRPQLNLSVDTSQSTLGGRRRPGASTMSSDFELSSTGIRYKLISALLAVEASLNTQETLFKKSTPINLTVDSNVVTQGGKYWSAQWTVNDSFVVPSILARIISIDEYYIDKVTREVRNCLVFEEQRRFFIPLESQTLTVFDEDRINQVDYEPRQLRTEPGTPIQVGSRNRRITA